MSSQHWLAKFAQFLLSLNAICVSCRPAGLNKQEEQSKAAVSANVPFVGNSDESSSEDDLPPLFQNNNRQVIYRHEPEDSASDAEQ